MTLTSMSLKLAMMVQHKTSTCIYQHDPSTYSKDIDFENFNPNIFNIKFLLVKVTQVRCYGTLQHKTSDQYLTIWKVST